MNKPSIVGTLLLLAGVITACTSQPESADGEGDTASTAAAVCATGPTVEGIDVSAYQGAIDWGAVHAAGIQFAIARIGDGTYQDPTFHGNWAGIRNAGMIRGAYQYFRAGEDPNVLADIAIGAVGRLGDGDLPVTVDIEEVGGPGAAQMIASVRTWVSRVTAGTGKPPMIYSGYYYWNERLAGTAEFSGLPLWIASYGVTCPPIPNAWQKWAFHQYTDVGGVPGVGGSGLDHDRFDGTPSELRAFASAKGGCTEVETANAAHFGCACADGKASGGFCNGTGCSAQETHDAAQFGCGCVDHQANGAFCAGTGCTPKETLDAEKFGCTCVDHKANGGFCPGTGCTAKETKDAAKFGCGCVDHKGSGGACAGTGCTPHETKTCAAQGRACSLHHCK